MVWYSSSNKTPPCILLPSIPRGFLLRRVWREMRGFHQTSVPNRASLPTAGTDKADRLSAGKGGEGKKKTRNLFVAPSPHSSHNFLSCPRGTNVQLSNANSVRSYCCYFPCEKCQMDGDFLLYDFMGVVTIPCQEDTLSQFDKWGIIMKRPSSSPKIKPKVLLKLSPGCWNYLA